MLTPGHYLQVQLGGDGEAARVSEHTYWQLDFPDAGHEYSAEAGKLTDEFEESAARRAWKTAAGRRAGGFLHASGGVDSSVVVAMSSKVRARRSRRSPSSIRDPKLGRGGPGCRGHGPPRRHPARRRGSGGGRSRAVPTRACLIQASGRDRWSIRPARRHDAAGRASRTSAGLQGGADRRRRRRVAGRLFVAQGQPRAKPSGPDPRPAAERTGPRSAHQVHAVAVVPFRLHGAVGAGGRRPQRLARRLRPDEPVQDAVLQPVDERGHGGGRALRRGSRAWTRIGCGAGTRSTGNCA